MSFIRLYNEDCVTLFDRGGACISEDDIKRLVLVTDPPFNVGYKYNTYKDSMPEAEYLEWIKGIVTFYDVPFVLVHYPDMLHKISITTGIAPERVVSWVYNSNTAKQHRDIAYYKVIPDFKRVRQPYKNPNDKRIKQRIAEGKMGAKLYDWWEINQVKNVSKEKTAHPCQMPLEVMKRVIGILPDNVLVVDPFLGSGTTGLACKELGVDFIGCEIDRDYYEIAKKRLGV